MTEFDPASFIMGAGAMLAIIIVAEAVAIFTWESLHHDDP